MEHEVPVKLFKNAAVRHQYFDYVIAAFEAAHSHVELIMLYQDFQPKLESMLESPEEYDRMTVEIIHTRYRGLHTRLDEQEERLKKMEYDYHKNWSNHD